MNKTEKQRYERMCSNLNNLLSKGALFEWDTGHALDDLHKSQLWTKVQDETRGGFYTSFNRFLQREFGLGEKKIIHCRRLSKTFTRDQVKGWRGDRLHTLANVKNPLRRQKLYNMASKKSFSEVEKEVRKLPPSELFFQVQTTTAATATRGRKEWSLSDIQHMLDEYKNAYIRLDVGRGKYRVSLVQGAKILSVGVSSRLTRAIGDLKVQLERQRQRSVRSA